MYVDIYKSDICNSKYLVVPANTVVTGNALGVSDPDFSKFSIIKKSELLEPGMIGINDVRAKSDINSIGYHILRVRTSFQEDTTKN
ncbi:hypothetical protein ACKW9A_004513 [Escherichia coli]|mgnify:CR=1 FL=1|uniref:hypothetical protein n=1 Tax=Escherichia coli TaxID=562 RepID=UPI0006A559C9|nr:hypothetical protein [Escherichia coli]EEZ5669900.1 hypothetical protein [Escherichia coli O2]EFW7441647.1 hypothetical protein [Shigella sonnei]EFJ2135210.1 hypothetical protein [Escherichia coli]EHB7580720.1 hypothetical protein [Escherichia coli]EHU9185876.1 hypothetical protein [Escherichia coli]